MAKKVTEHPPIYTADGKPLSVGMKIYYTQESCVDNMPYMVQVGTVAGLDLGTSRSVRIRKAKGREVVITVSSRAGLCRVEGVREELLFATKAAACREAVKLSASIRVDLDATVRAACESYEVNVAEEVAATRARNNWRKDEVNAANANLAKFDKALAVLNR